MDKKISVVIPIYSVEDSIRKCVKSVIDQTYKNLEIILVDDGSPDNSGKIADSFAKIDDRIKVIHQENKGLCGARNTGLDASTGEYICFFDSDDYIMADMIEYLYNNLLKYEADISACRYFRVKKNEKMLVATDGLTRVMDTDEAIRDIVTKFDLRTVFWNKLFKREIFNNVRFPEGKVFEGTNMMHKVIEQANKIVLLPDPKYFYIDNQTSIINTNNIKNYCDYVLGFVKRYNDLQENYPDLRPVMLGQFVKNSILFLKKLSCFSNKKLSKYKKQFKKIYDFIIAHYDEIAKLPDVKKITLWELMSYKKIKRSRLKLIVFLKKAQAKFGKLFKKRKKKLPPKKKKIAIPMTDLTDDDMAIFKRMHKCEQYLLDEFVRICTKHDLKYFLYGGTLLGAVRHKGFIPWDDDIDIVMPREDYDKFAQVAPQELGEEFFYQSNKIEPDFNMLFSKIRLKNTYVREEKFDNKNMHQGIFIDILPLDLYPKMSGLKEKILLEKFNVLNSACQAEKCASKRLLSKLWYKLYKLLPNSTLQKKRDKFIRTLCKDKNTELICSFGSHYRPIKRRVLKREWFQDTGLKMEFEGKTYSVPKGWKEYLVHLYGPNYMQLPPEEERINHFDFYAVQFDKEKAIFD